MCQCLYALWRNGWIPGRLVIYWCCRRALSSGKLERNDVWTAFSLHVSSHDNNRKNGLYAIKHLWINNSGAFMDAASIFTWRVCYAEETYGTPVMAAAAFKATHKQTSRRTNRQTDERRTETYVHRHRIVHIIQIIQITSVVRPNA